MAFSLRAHWTHIGPYSDPLVGPYWPPIVALACQDCGLPIVPQTVLALRGSHGVALVPGISPSLWSGSAAELPARMPPLLARLFQNGFGA